MPDDAATALDAVVQLEARLIAAGSPYELSVVKREDVSFRVYRHAPPSLNELYRKALGMGKATLAVFGDRRISYSEAFSKAALVASILRRRFAVSPEVRVAIMLEDRPEWMVAFIAVTSLGATAVLVDVRNSAALAHSLKVAGCTLAIVEHSIAHEISGSPSRVRHWITFGGNDADRIPESGHISRWDALLQEAQANQPQVDQYTQVTHELPRGHATLGGKEAAAQFDSSPPFAEEREAIIAFTSGTTGTPKGVLLTHYGITTGLMNMAMGGFLANAASSTHGVKKTSAKERLRQAPCALVLAPLSYIGGYTQLLLALTVGGKLVLQDHWDVEAVCRAIDRELVRSLVGATPMQIRELMRRKPDAGSLTSIGIHGLALPRTLLDELAAQWPQVTVGSGYGMTETNGSIAAIAGETLRQYPDTAGRVLPTVEVRIVGPDGRDVKEGELGEIWLRGASLMRGYCVETGGCEGLVEGWFRTGDLGCLSPYRFLSVVDRLGHVIEVGSVRISTLDLERVIAADDEVADVAVIYEREGVDGISFIVAAVPRFGAVLDRDRIRRIVVEHCSIAEEAVNVVEVPSLPKNRSGKLDRKVLHAELATPSQNTQPIHSELVP